MAKGSYSKTPTATKRPERLSALSAQYNANKKIILATQSICGICGKPVDKSIKYPDPMSPTIDHIIPVALNGDPVALDINVSVLMPCTLLLPGKESYKKTGPIVARRK